MSNRRRHIRPKFGRYYGDPTLAAFVLSEDSGTAPAWNYTIGLVLNLVAAAALVWRHEHPWPVLAVAVAGPLVFSTDATAALIALVAGASHRVDSNLVHVTGTGVLVRRKNEVILADILESMVPGRWVYEQELIGTDGTVRYPDFTIETTTGRRIVWEHLGMLDDPQYAANWEAKKQWYRANGMLPLADDGGPE